MMKKKTPHKSSDPLDVLPPSIDGGDLGDQTHEPEIGSQEEPANHDPMELVDQYRFIPTAPKTLNVDGDTKTLEEIKEDVELMESLINGNCGFLERTAFNI